MAAFEAPIGNPELARKLQGITAMSIRIARSAMLLDNMNHFVQSCVEPRILTDGEHVFDYGYFSGIAPSGTMIHVRSSAGKDDGRPADPDHQFAVVTGSLYDHDLYMYSTTTTERSHQYDGRHTTDILLGVPQEGESRVLQLVGDDVTTQTEWLTSDEWLDSELERYLEADKATQQLASLHHDGRVWAFRHGDGRMENLRGLQSVRAEIDLATKRGLAGAALMTVDTLTNREDNSGHFAEKVVG